MELNVKNINPVGANLVKKSDFLQETPKDQKKMYREIVSIIKSISNTHLKALLKAFFQDKKWRRCFVTAPAAKQNHQAYIGGLLEHTYNMVRLVPALAKVYPINIDLLYTGVILHDIGKIQEYLYDYKIDISSPGRFLGHIVIGIGEVERKIAEIPDFPEELRLKLLHMIASHHGSYEWQSPRLPAFLEACLLHHLDLLDSQAFHFVSLNNNSESKWQWCHALGRYIFI